MAEGIDTLRICSSSGSIESFILLGLESGVAPDVTPFVVRPERVDSTELYLLPLAEQNAMKILSLVGCQNAYPYPMPPITTWDGFADLFNVAIPHIQDHLEGWFFWRERIRNPLLRSQSQYSQIWQMRITGVAWHEDYTKTRKYMQERNEQLMRTLERNKDLGLGPGSEITALQSRVEFSGDSSEVSTGETWMWKTHIQFDLEVFRLEPTGLNVT